MLSNCAWMETQNAEQLHGKYQYISFKVQHFREFGIRIKTRGAPELHPLRVMTRDRGGGDDRKLFHSSPSVNYSFPLIRLLSPPPRPSSTTPSPATPFPPIHVQSETLSELIPGNVYFDEQIAALLLTQRVNVDTGTGTANPQYHVGYASQSNCLSSRLF